MVHSGWYDFSLSLVKKLINILLKSFCLSFVMENLNRCTRILPWKLQESFSVFMPLCDNFVQQTTHWGPGVEDDRPGRPVLGLPSLYFLFAVFLLCYSRKSCTNRELHSVYRFMVYFVSESFFAIYLDTLPYYSIQFIILFSCFTTCICPTD